MSSFRGLVVLILLSAVYSVYSLEIDPCATIAGQQFVVPSHALACLKSFPFNETLRQNVLSVVSRVFDFYTFENWYLKSPPPFLDSTIDIRKQLIRINSTKYDVSILNRLTHLNDLQEMIQTDYDFNKDLYNFVNQLNDGHTRM